ncbi:hypothetical protein J2Z21_007647 [Streptomyces griseochromogenes]|uniref:Uncharacterized protein n=1 Tax=Streptomyces griseochromogenes TaxID=68214 RepID=A0A1B1B441_9ACTN|nr:hypothetical protein [Streptomyces griseochromogenes]ANP53531.1 hypothetical protein AVL59_31880 [Streptomyces griseochromogenes]MBP2054637.1 hypothetical protein [Streptomyces griseochromogenes]
MDIAECLTLMDLLCAREFPAAPGGWEHGESGPGYHIAALRTSAAFWEDDGTEWEETAAQYEADRDGLVQRLTARWGQSQHISLRGVLDRALEGEDIEEPWASLSEHVPDVHLWQAPASGRWVALGVSHGHKELPFQLLGVVTETDPY